MKETKLHMYSVAKLYMDHVDEVCEDIKHQYEIGTATMVLFSLQFTPEGKIPLERVKRICESYKVYRKRLTEMGLPCGILLQSTIGHGRAFDVKDDGFSYQKYIALSDGEPRYVCCPYDKGFQEYMFEVARMLAECGIDAAMVDDDFRMIARDGRGCVCPLHLKRFNELAGTNFTREQLSEYMYSDDHGETEYTRIFEYIQKESLIETAKAIRAGFDSVDPTIPCAFACVDAEMQFAPEIAGILAGDGNPTVVRIGNGYYTANGPRGIVNSYYRAAYQIAKLKGSIDVFQSESDTCPHNRYSTAAVTVHSHITGSILEGVGGAKLWITRVRTYEPESGKAYRKILSKYNGFYKALVGLVPTLKWRGCRMPVGKVSRLTTGSGWGYQSDINSGWSKCLIDRLGIPMFFSADNEGVLCLEGRVDRIMTDEQLLEAFHGPVMAASNAAKRLIDRGFGEYLGVDVREITGRSPSVEVLAMNGVDSSVQHECKMLVPLSDDVMADTTVYHSDSAQNRTALFPGTTVYKNKLGGTSIVFSGTPAAEFHYSKFAFLNYTRKQQIIDLLSGVGELPVYYPGDEEVYMKAADLPDGGCFCAMFNIGLDPIEQVELMCAEPVGDVQMLMPDGTRKSVPFEYKDGRCSIEVPCYTLQPLILFLK